MEACLCRVLSMPRAACALRRRGSAFASMRSSRLRPRCMIISVQLGSARRGVGGFGVNKLRSAVLFELLLMLWLFLRVKERLVECGGRGTRVGTSSSLLSATMLETAIFAVVRTCYSFVCDKDARRFPQGHRVR